MNRILRLIQPWCAVTAFLLILPGSALAITIGPDAFGYRATNETPYAFEEIAGTGTPLNFSDDVHFYGIPFNFNFYGAAYNQIAVGSNGTVYFENNYLGLVNTTIPSANSYGVDRFIATYWDDLNPGAGGDVYWEKRGAGPTERLIVEWKDVPRYFDSGAGTFQAVLYRQSGEIYAYYADTNFGSALIDFGRDATAGIQGSVTTGLQWSYNQPVLTNGLALRYFLIPEPTSLGMMLLAAGLIGFVRRSR